MDLDNENTFDENGHEIKNENWNGNGNGNGNGMREANGDMISFNDIEATNWNGIKGPRSSSYAPLIKLIDETEEEFNSRVLKDNEQKHTMKLQVKINKKRDREREKERRKGKGEGDPNDRDGREGLELDHGEEEDGDKEEHSDKQVDLS